MRKLFIFLFLLSVFVFSFETHSRSEQSHVNENQDISLEIIDYGIIKKGDFGYQRPEEEGRFSVISNFKIGQTTTSIPLEKDIGFAISWIVSGIDKDTKTIVADYTVSHPELTLPNGTKSTSYRKKLTIDVVNGIAQSLDGYILNRSHEFVSGEWTISIEYDGVSAHKTFDIYETLTSPKLNEEDPVDESNNSGNLPFWLKVSLGIFFFVIVLVIVLFLSEKSGIKSVEWTSRILPPLLLLLLIYIPIDFITHLLWLIGGCFVLFSVIRIIYLVIKYLRIKLRRKANKTNLKAFVRPLLCIASFFIAYFFVNKSVYSANAKAIELALEMQEYVSTNGKCNESTPDWADKSPYNYNSVGMYYGEYGTTYSLIYRCEIADRNFVYSVRVNKDVSFTITGYFDGKMEVEFGHYIDPKKIALNKNLDLSELAKMKVKYKE